MKENKEAAEQFRKAYSFGYSHQVAYNLASTEASLNHMDEAQKLFEEYRKNRGPELQKLKSRIATWEEIYKLQNDSAELAKKFLDECCNKGYITAKNYELNDELWNLAEQLRKKIVKDSTTAINRLITTNQIKPGDIPSRVLYDHLRSSISGMISIDFYRNQKDLFPTDVLRHVPEDVSSFETAFEALNFDLTCQETKDLIAFMIDKALACSKMLLSKDDKSDYSADLTVQTMCVFGMMLMQNI